MISQKLGIEVENLSSELSRQLGYTAGDEGVVVTKVKPGSPAAIAGLRPTFLITGVAIDWDSQKPIKNIGEFAAAMQQLGDKKYVILIVRHQNFQKYYTIKLT